MSRSLENVTRSPDHAGEIWPRNSEIVEQSYGDEDIICEELRNKGASVTRRVIAIFLRPLVARYSLRSRGVCISYMSLTM